MSNPILVRPGSGWCDVCAVPDGYAFVYVDGFAVVCEINGVKAWRIVGPEPLLFLRCAYVDGAVLAVGQGNDTGRALLTVGGSPLRSAGMTFGVNPVALDEAKLYVVRTAIEYDAMTISGEVVDTHLMPDSSQGIRDVVHGDVRFADDWFSREPRRGFKLIQPCQRGQVMVGQSAVREQIDGVGVSGPFTALPGAGFEPHVAQLGAGVYAICARTPQGAALTVVPPYPPLIVNPPPPPPPPEDPVPDVPDYSAFVATVPLPTLAEQRAINATTNARRNALVADGIAHGLSEQDAKDRAESDPQVIQGEHDVNQLKGPNCERIIAAVNAKEGRTDWGLLTKSAGQHWTRSDGKDLSTDIAFHRVLLRLVDCMSDTGPGWGIHGPEDVQPIEKWVAPLASEPPPIDPPDEPDPVDLGPILARLDRLELRVTALETPHEPPPPVDLKPLEERVAVLERKRYRVSGKTATSFGHQHNVSLNVEEIK